MRELDFRAPDEAAMERLLAAHRADNAGVVLRLAWRAGLTRDEIVSLTWEQVDFTALVLRLGSREVPMDAELGAVLLEKRAYHAQTGESRVVPLAPQSASRLARRALDEAGQTRVRLIDLRLDFVRRQLREHDWPYVLRITGFSVTTYRLSLAQLQEGGVPAAPPRHGEDAETRLRQVMESARATPAGIALWLSHGAGLRADEIVSLTWKQVDFAAHVLRLARGDVPMSAEVSAALSEEKERCAQDENAHVILTPHTRRPMDASRLSTLVRDALIRGGVENRSLADVRLGAAHDDAERAVLALARENGSVARGNVMRALGMSDSAAYRRLKALVKAGELVRVGTRYYPPGAVVPPDRQAEAIRAYLAQYGTAYRQDIAELLHIAPRPAARILKRMVDGGELICLPRERRYVPARDETGEEPT